VRSVSPQTIVLFFVDKDFSDFLSENYPKAGNIYVTDFYSIENYLVSEDMLIRVWNEIIRFPNTSIDTSVIIQKFQVQLARFYNFVLPITAWIVYLRRKGIQPNINNVNFSRIFYFNEDLVIGKKEEIGLRGEIERLERTCGVVTPKGFLSHLGSLTKEFVELEPKTYIRGKFELWFFVKFIEKLTSMLRATISDLGESIGMKTQISEDNAIEVLGPRLQIPPSLDRFLHENISL